MFLRDDQENVTLPAAEQVTQVAKLLMKAKGVLEQRGWCQGVMCDAEDAVCARGAIYAAAGARITSTRLWVGDLGVADARAANAADDAFRRAFGDTTSVPRWNDAPGRTREEVLAVFDKAIATERARR